MTTYNLTGNAYLVFPTDTVASWAWEQISGPETVTFDTPSQKNVMVTIPSSTAGTYVIRLTVTDSSGNVATSDVSTTLQAC